MKIIKYLDNYWLNHDALTEPFLSAAEPALSADQLVKKFLPVGSGTLFLTSSHRS